MIRLHSMHLPRRTDKLGVIIAAALLAGTLAAPPPAQAAGVTQFVYSPVACRTVGGALWIYPSGQLSNKSVSEPMRLFCPLIHEAKAERTDRVQVSVVQANQHHKDAQGQVMRVECRAFVNHPHANDDPKWSVSAWHGQSAASSGVETATITIPDQRWLGGSLMLECLLPPRDPQGHNQPLFNGESRIGTYKSGVD